MHNRSRQVLDYIAKWFRGTSLTHRQRQVLAGYFFLEWKTSRIAKALGLKQGTVRNMKLELAQKFIDEPAILNVCLDEWPLGRGQQQVVEDFLKENPVRGMGQLRDALIEAS